jgi:hypothetical protein
MDADQFLAIARIVAGTFLIHDDPSFRESQNIFYNYKLYNISRLVVNLLRKIRDEIDDSEFVTKSEQDSFRQFRKESVEMELDELERQKNIEKKAKKLKAIDRKRKKNEKIPYPQSSYDYGDIIEEYDPLTGKTSKRFVPNLTPEYEAQNTNSLIRKSVRTKF